jgi:hypothetical protein
MPVPSSAIVHTDSWLPSGVVAIVSQAPAKGLELPAAQAVRIIKMAAASEFRIIFDIQSFLSFSRYNTVVLII